MSWLKRRKKEKKETESITETELISFILQTIMSGAKEEEVISTLVEAGFEKDVAEVYTVLVGFILQSLSEGSQTEEDILKQLIDGGIPSEDAERILGIVISFLGSLNSEETEESEEEKQRNEAYSAGVEAYNSGNYREALAHFEKSLKLSVEIYGLAHPDVGRDYNNIGFLYKALGDYDKALEYYDKALKIDLKVLGPDHPDVGTMYNNIAGVYKSLDDYDKALEYYNRALEIGNRALGPDHPSVGTRYNNIGFLYKALGDYDKALEYYDKALKIDLKVLGPDHPDVGTMYNNIAGVYESLGNYGKALEYMNKALQIDKKALGPDHPSVGRDYNNLGNVYNSLGNYDKALEYMNKALQIDKKALGPDHPSVGSNYNNLGGVYNSLGDYDKALECYNRALEIQKKVLGPDNSLYNNIGFVYDSLGDYDKALECYNRALEIDKKALGPDHPDVGRDYNNLGAVYKSLHDYDKALEYMKKALEIDKKALGPDHPSVGTMYNNLGAVYKSLHDYDKALEYMKKALEIDKKALSPDHPSVAADYTNMGVLYYSLGQYDKALEYYKKAVSIYDSVRSSIGLETMKKTYFKTVEDAYKWAVELCLKLGKDDEAFTIIEKSKSRSFVELLAGKTEPKPESDDKELLELISQRKELEQRLTALYKKMTSDEIGTNEPETTERALKTMREKVSELNSELESVNRRIQEKDPKYYSVTHVDDLDVREFQKSIPENACTLQYFFIDDDKSAVLYVDKETLLSGTIDHSKEEFDAVLNSLSGNSTAEGIKAEKLIPPEILEKIKDKSELWISPHKKLHFFPFSVLKCSDDSYLIEKIGIKYFPSFSVMKYMKPSSVGEALMAPRAEKSVFGNPTKDLMNAEFEANEIARDIDAVIFVEEKVTRENIVSQMKKDRILHYSGHVFYDPENPLSTHIPLANGILQADEIMNLTIDDDLVTLSGCESALGDATGDEIGVLSRAFLYAGTKTLIATLWKIDDRLTADFMTEFYENIRSGLSVTDAMRETQIGFIEDGRNPYYWAPFVVIGG